ncbi:MAG: leucine-rich repeat domain-containing protein, partial [Clostridia bacterium]|nr:leucine-rich repeat domain-containing protein [Clostridia bacterium]
TSIEAYAFAKLTALEEVELPTTLNKIGVGAFLGCEKLKKINLGNVKFINKDAFVNTKIENIDLTSVVAIGDYSFANTRLNYVELPESSQSLGVGAFMNNKYLTSVVFNAPKIKIGDSAFEGCSQLRDMNINAAVISKKAFYNCSQLSNVTLGKDVVVIGEYAFANTNVAKFNVISGGAFTMEANGAMLLKNNELVLVAPKYSSNTVTLTTATAIGKGAFAGKTNIYKVYANNVKTVGAYAFADCSNLSVIELNSLETVGEYAFFGTAITQTPNLAAVTSIGNYAFAQSALATVNISDGMKVGNYAFANCNSLVEVVVGDDVELGKGAFMSQIKYNNLENFTKEDEAKGITIAAFLNAYYDRYTYYVKDENGAVVEELDYYRYKMEDGAKSKLATVTIGEGVTIGEYAFDGNMKLINLTIGDGSSIGECAFFNANSLVNVDLSGVTSVGDYAFSGSQILDLWLKNYRISYAVEQSYVDGKAVATEYVYRFYAPVITEADLSSAKSVGKYAFAMNSALEEVTFGENGMTEIADYAFAATSIENLVLPSTVEKIGEYAFNRTKISSVDLSAVKTVGKYAFGGTALTSVTLAEDGVVEDGAFESCENLATVNNLSKIVSIGANAFRGTKIKVADISSATYVGDFAFGESDVEDIVFGDKLVRLGENPFYACKISTFATTADVSFNDSIIGEEIVTTYDISDTVKVIDDALYQVLANG